MENLESRTLKLKEDVTLVSIEDKAALLDVERRCCYDPNDTAFFLLKLMEGGCSYEHMAAELVSEFDVAAETARGDIDHFVEGLLRLGLVELGEEATAREIEGEPNKEKKAYLAPQLEHQAEIAVVGGINNAAFS